MKSVASSAGRRWRTPVVILLAGGLFAACSLAVARKVDAALDGGLMQLGSEALTFPGMLPSPTGTIRINGIDLSYRVETVPASLVDVWEHYAASCGGRTRGGGAMGTLVRALATRGASSDTQAYVACLDLRRDDLSSVVQLAGEVTRTWDLTRLGALRYVYARRDPFDPARTLLFSMWVDHSLDLRNFVRRGSADAPGDDPQFVPRPLASHRVLSVKCSSQIVAVYRVPHATPDAQARWYAQRLRSKGWRLASGSDHGFVEIDGILLVVAEDGSRSVTVAISTADSGSTLVSAVEAEAL